MARGPKKSTASAASGTGGGGGKRGGGGAGKREPAPATRGGAKRVTRRSAEEARKAGRSVDVRDGLPNDYKERLPKSAASPKVAAVKAEKGEDKDKKAKKKGDGVVGGEKGGYSAGAKGGSDDEDEGENDDDDDGDEATAIEIVASQETVFQKAAEDLKSALSDALPDVPVKIVEGLKGNFEIRKKGEETFLQHKDLKRPYKELKDMDAKKVAADIVKRWTTQEEQF